jgi:hypothetical protein
MDQNAQPVAVCPKTISPTSAIKFNEDTLWRLQIGKEAIPKDGTTVIIVDYARESGPRNDESAILIANVWSVGAAKQYTIIDILSDRWSVLELPFQVVEAMKKHNATALYVERLSNWQLLSLEISRYAKKRGVDLGRVVFFAPSKRRLAKAERLKKLHRLCEANSVRFVGGKNYLNKLITQLVRFDFNRKTNISHDDVADTCGLLVTHC